MPEATHLQILALSLISGGEIAGALLRDGLAANDNPLTGPKFYRFMDRLESSDWVEGRYTQEMIESQIIRQRLYRITSEGQDRLEEARRFYRSIFT